MLLNSKFVYQFSIITLLIQLPFVLIRLKLDNCHQYFLNAKGSTPADVMGVDYKTTIKPALDSFAEDIKKSSMTKLEDLISLRQQSSENTAKIESRRSHIVSLQSHIEEVSEVSN